VGGNSARRRPRFLGKADAGSPVNVAG